MCRSNRACPTGGGSFFACNRLPVSRLGRVKAGKHTGGDGFGIALYSRQLPGDEYPGMVAERKRLGQHPGSIDVGIAMNLAEAQKFGILQTWNEAQNPCLLAKFEVVLQADQIIGVGA